MFLIFFLYLVYFFWGPKYWYPIICNHVTLAQTNEIMQGSMIDYLSRSIIQLNSLMKLYALHNSIDSGYIG